MELTKRDRKTLARLEREAAMRKAFPNGTHMLAPGEKAPISRPPATSQPCTCGRTISANKEHCLGCTEAIARLRANFEALGLHEREAWTDQAAAFAKLDQFTAENAADLEQAYPDSNTRPDFVEQVASGFADKPAAPQPKRPLIRSLLVADDELGTNARIVTGDAMAEYIDPITLRAKKSMHALTIGTDAPACAEERLLAAALPKPGEDGFRFDADVEHDVTPHVSEVAGVELGEAA